MSRLVHRIMIMDRSEKLCYGVTLSQAYTIGALQKNSMLTMNELSQELGLAMSTLTRIIDVLVKNEIVMRQQSTQDRRKVCVELTDKGKDLAEKLKVCGEKFWQKIIDEIPREKMDEIANNLQILLNALEKAEQTCFPKI